MEQKALSAYFAKLGRKGGRNSSANMSPEARALRSERGSVLKAARQEKAFAEIARELKKRPEIVTFADLLRYRDMQLAAMEAGQVTRELYRKRIRRATKRFNQEYRGPQ